MEEIKITFDSKDINVKTGETSGHELLTALGTAFLEACEEFNIEPLSAIEILMDVEDTTEDEEDEDDESVWYDDLEECVDCGMPFDWCECDEGVFWVENDEEEEE